MTRKKRLSAISQNIFKILILIVFMSPFYVALNYALKTKQEIAQTGLAWPEAFHFENFTEAIRQTLCLQGCLFFKVLMNTVVATVVGTIVIVFYLSDGGLFHCQKEGKYIPFAIHLMVVTLLVPIQAYMFPCMMNLGPWDC